jgi:hypothetical protein
MNALFPFHADGKEKEQSTQRQWGGGGFAGGHHEVVLGWELD